MLWIPILLRKPTRGKRGLNANLLCCEKFRARSGRNLATQGESRSLLTRGALSTVGGPAKSSFLSFTSPALQSRASPLSMTATPR